MSTLNIWIFPPSHHFPSLVQHHPPTTPSLLKCLCCSPREQFLGGIISPKENALSITLHCQATCLDGGRRGQDLISSTNIPMWMQTTVSQPSNENRAQKSPHFCTKPSQWEAWKGSTSWAEGPADHWGEHNPSQTSLGDFPLGSASTEYLRGKCKSRAERAYPGVKSLLSSH